MRPLELPLLKRELIELAQRKRTYALRCLCLAVFSLVFFTWFAELQRRAVNITWALGQGRELTAILYACLMVTIYALAPAMACSAITSEKEKQTLGLLLISRLQPWNIIFEKLFSRMLPLASLTVVAAPLFGIAYLFGGISFADTLAGFSMLLFALFQVTVVAIFCSALLESGIAAFWGTYISLGTLYFAWPLLTEAGFLPRPELSSTMYDEEFLFFPGYQIAMLLDGTRSAADVALLTVPQLLVTLLFLVAARVALVRYSLGAAFSPGKQLRNLRDTFSRRVRMWLPGRATRTARKPEERAVISDRALRSLPAEDAVGWREKKSTAMIRPRRLIVFTSILILLQSWVVSAASQYHLDEHCAMFSFGWLILGLLMVLATSSRLFAKERERQTLDSLLVAPLTNAQILRGKSAVANRMILMLLIPVLVTCVFNILFTNLRLTSDYRRRVVMPLFSSGWIVAAFLYMLCAIGNAFIYMQLVKWVALYFGLWLNTQMKAMVASLVTILVICFVPLLTLVMTVLLARMDPDDFPLFFFISPMLIPVLNEFHEWREVLHRTGFPDSQLFAILVNFVIYGGLMLVVRAMVRMRLPTMLQRRD